jgi:hypothetical protein
MKTPGIRAAWGQMMGDAFYCGEVRRLVVEA